MSKKRINGKQKGNKFERDICKELSLWITYRKSNSIFWRSAMSGGRATIVDNKLGADWHSGDICATDPRGYPWIKNCYFELKCYTDIKVKSIITESPKQDSLYAFLIDTEIKADELNKIPILIYKENNSDIFIAIGKGEHTFIFMRLKDLIKEKPKRFLKLLTTKGDRYFHEKYKHISSRYTFNKQD